MDKRRLAEIEQHIFELFRLAGTSRLLTQKVFDGTTRYANADLVRAFEDLEKKWRLLTRYTDEGNDWLRLTTEGAVRAGLRPDSLVDQRQLHPHPPKSSP
jgi:hypothetical protein